MSNPIDNPIDYVTIAGQKTPGIARVSGASSPQIWNKAQGYGLSGAILRYAGRDLSEFDITIKLLTTADWDAWRDFRKVVTTPPKGRYPKALDVWHPFLEECGIKSAVVKNVQQPEDSGGNGTWEVVIKMSEYRRPKMSLAKPEGSKAETAPQDPAEQMIADLTKQVQELSK